MNCEWRTATRIFMAFVVIVGLIYKFNNAPTDFRNFSVHCRPTIVLKLCDFQRIIYFAIRDVKFATSIIWTTFAVHIFHKNMVVLNLIVSPISWTLPRAISNLRMTLRTIDYRLN